MNREELSLEESQRLWDSLSSSNPLEAILAGGHGKRWDVSMFFATGRAEVAAILSYLAKQGVSIQRNDALDFGCGVGRLTQAFAEVFERVVGVDISQSMLEAANELNRSFKNVHYVMNPRPDLAFLPDECMDFVYSNIALQHIDSRFSSQYIRDFFRLLRPGAIALFQLPAESFLHRMVPVAILKGVRKVIFGSPDPGLFGMTPEAVRAVIDHAGGQIVDIQEITGGPAWGAPLTTSVRGRGFRGYPISLDPFVSYRYLSRRLAPSRGSASGRDTGNRPPSE